MLKHGSGVCTFTAKVDVKCRAKSRSKEDGRVFSLTRQEFAAEVGGGRGGSLVEGGQGSIS